MESAILKVNLRETEGSKANKRLRKEGLVPGNVFGKGQPSVAVTIRQDELKKGLAKHGRFALFKLEADKGGLFDAMVKDIQVDPITREYVHVDFQQIKMSEEVKATVPVRIEGRESLEFRKLLVVHQIDAIPVKGMPQDIPNSLEIDGNKLNAGDNVFVNDIPYPAGIVPEINPELLVLSVSEAKVNRAESEEDTIAEA